MLERRFVRFLIGGGVNTLLTFGLFALLSPRIGPLWAYGSVYALGIAFAYLFNALLVFGATPSLATAALFPLVYVAQFVWGLGVMAVTVEWLRWDDLVGLLLVVVTSLPLTFALNRLVLDGRSPAAGAHPPAGPRPDPARGG